jgi:hypothetical protein
MTRRTLLLSTVRAAGPSRNDVSHAGNAFHDLWREWAVEWNAVKTGGISAPEAAVYERMCKAFDGFKRKRTAWLRGL